MHKNVNFSYLDEVDISIGKVTLKRVEGTPHAMIQYPGSIEDFLDFGFRDGQFYVRLKDGAPSFYGPINVVVETNDLKKITLSNQVDLKTEDTFRVDSLGISMMNDSSIDLDFEGNSLDIEMSNNGKSEIRGKVNRLISSMSNATDMDALNLQADIVIATVSNVAKMRTAVDSSLTVNLSNEGKIIYKGEPSDIKKTGIMDSAELIKL